MNKLLVNVLLIMLFPLIAIAEITPNDVAEKMKAGDTQTAELFTQQILKEHPNSAKAHYYMGQILAIEGKYKRSYQELKEAANLDRSLSFASSPDRFRIEMDKVKVNLGDAPAPAISSQQDSSSHWGLILFILIAGGMICWFFIRKKPESDEAKENPYKPTPSPSSPSGAQANYQSPLKEAATNSPIMSSTYRPTYAPSYPQPHVVNNYNSSNDGLVTGMLLGSMLSDHGHTNTVIDRETIVERNTTNNIVERDSFDSGSNYSPSKSSFDSGSDSSSSFDSGSSSFDSGGSSFDSGSSDSSW